MVEDGSTYDTETGTSPLVGRYGEGRASADD